MTTVSAPRLASVFVEMADTLVADFDLIEFLQLVTTRAAELVDASAAGLLLADHRGDLRFMAASDENTKLLELFQVQNHEGPCQDAYRRGAPIINADLTQAEVTWPLFAPRAAAAGFRSVHAIPLRLRDETIGALNIFGTDVGALEPADVQIVQALADVATIGLLQERAIRRADVLAEQLQGALQSRVAIEQAKGAVAEHRGVDIDEAFALIRGHARRTGRRLVDVAYEAVGDPSSVSDTTPV